MTIREQENQLYNEFQSPRKKIIRDGIVDEAIYKRSKPKLLFLLKEVNYPDAPETWDLRDYVKEHARGYTWDNIARWVLGIQNFRKDLSWETVQAEVKKNKYHLLRSIVAMNVKKSPGGASADAAQLQKWAGEHGDLLRRQFALYRPDLVVCCGFSTSDAAKAAGLIEPNSGVQSKHGVWYTSISKKTKWITFYHPQARYPHHLMYYGLIDAAREVLASD